MEAVAGLQTITARHPIKKYMIICITCLITVALLVIGALVAVKLITGTEKEIFHVSNI